MLDPRCSLLALLLAAPHAIAQKTIVSPAGLATTEGDHFSSVPFNSGQPRRYMQIHDDIGGSAKLINKLSFRLNAGNVNSTGTRRVTMELYMGHGFKYPAVSYTFDRNYRDARVKKIARSTIDFGPLGQSKLPGPNPFTGKMDLVLPSPFAYNGKDSLVWEAVIFSNAGRGANGSPDADGSSTTFGASSTVVGAGCAATGRRSPMRHRISHADVGGVYVANFSVSLGPADAPTVLSIGSRNPNQRVPGLCSPLLTDLMLPLIIGVTDDQGRIGNTTPTLSTLVLSNEFGGALLFSQCHALDTGRVDAIKITNSDGHRFQVPRANRTQTNRVARLFNIVGDTTATESSFDRARTIGYALVTQFTYN